MPRGLKRTHWTDPETGKQLIIYETGDHVVHDRRRPQYSWLPWVRARQKKCQHTFGRDRPCPKCGTWFKSTF